MQDEKHDDPANANSGNGATPNDGVGKNANAKGFGIVVRDVIGLIVAGIFATVFFSTAHIICGLWCSFISLGAAFHIPLQHYTDKNPHQRKQGWVCYGVLLFAIAVWFSKWSYAICSNKPDESKPTPVPTIAAVPQPDYIEGTEFTTKQMQDAFPFGYAIIYFGQNKIERYEIFKSGKMEWKIDMEKVVINPNFFTGKVYWTIPPISGSGNGLHDVTIENIPIACELTNGFANRAPINFGNNPVAYVITLSDNQLHPVFAIGFRIPEPFEKQGTH